MSSDKLGFTFYPNDWWTSDTFFKLDAFERYIYLECLFIMYKNNGYLKHTREELENRLRTEIKPNIWEKITQLFTTTEFGLSSPTMNKRLRKTLTNRENGKKGGRPKKPKKPNSETQKNPSYEKKENIIEYNIIEAKELMTTDNRSKLEAFFMQQKIQDYDYGLELMDMFLTEQSLSDGLKRDIKEIKTHFTNWVKKLPEDKRKRQPKKVSDFHAYLNIR